jgi:hypothetical protein
VGLSKQAINYRLQNPVRCAWISRQLCRVIPQRLGQIYASLYKKAIRGDVRAANLILERFDPMFRPAGGGAYTQINIGAAGPVDIRKLNDEELGARIQEKLTSLSSRGAVQTPGGTEDTDGDEPPEVPEAAQEAKDVPFEPCEGEVLPGRESER